MIRLDIKAKRYNGYPFVKNLSLSITSGDFVMIKGATGSGKSTILNMLNLLDNDFEGNYYINGVDITNASSGKKAKLRRDNFGIIFQDYNVIPRMTVLENVMFALNIISYSGDKEERAKEVIKMVELEGHEHKLFNELSGGQQQRIGIARGIVANPEIIFADEPTGNLDAETAEEILQLFIKLNKQGKTIILITHDEDILHYSNRLITIDQGRIISDESKKIRDKREHNINTKKNMSFLHLIRLGFSNLRRHSRKYLSTNITLLAALLLFMAALFSLHKLDDYADTNLETKNFRLELNYDADEENFDFNTVHDLYLQIGSEFDDAKVQTDLTANATILAVDDLVLSNLSDDELKEIPSTISFVDYQQMEDDYYLVAGTDPVNENEIVISEQFIQDYLDKTYDLRNGDPTQFVGKQLTLTLLNPNANSQDYTASDVVTTSFTITGVDNSKEGPLELYSNVYTSYDTLISLPDQIKLTPNTAIFIDPEKYQTVDIVQIMESLGYVQMADYVGTPEPLEAFSIKTPPQTTGNYILLAIISTVLVIIAIIIIMSFTMSNLLSLREKEFGIYYALGLDQFAIFKTVTVEFLINATLITFITGGLVFIILKIAYYREIIILPTIILSNVDFIYLLVFGITISMISLVIVFVRMLKQDPLKQIKKL